ncbi:hypothetical protein KI688_001991 [Linnemannia hyalina]|uniref:Chitin-binding type-4 domain-containing protein n=1 Tax=Linnemannia hyalina TaxID=64524 RepID=A0A9P7XRE1_9FUNG|nr:hypothetical protein KI688_001991 [Linnemannia hyalina]
MIFRTSVIASAALALVATMVEAHSWADCVDWRFNDPAKPGWRASDGKCFGWARQYPVNSGVQFGGLDSSSPSRHYQQNPKDFVPCSDHNHGIEPGADETRQSPISKAYGGRFGAMAAATAGQEICVRWPAKNHAKKDEPNNRVMINMPQTILTKDPSQSGFTAANIAKLDYKNCNQIAGDTDHTPCGGCFKVPAALVSGTYVIQWRWMLNNDEYYTSCWDLQVKATGGSATATPVVAGLGNSTTVFADLAEDN